MSQKVYLENVLVEEVKESEPLAKIYKVEFKLDILKNKIDSALQAKAQGIKKDGFRSQASNVTVPYALVERKYKKQIEQELIKDQVQEIISSITQEFKGTIIGRPEVKNFVNLNDKGVIKFELEFEVLPKITVPEFSAINLNHFVIDISDEIVDEQIRSILFSNTPFIEGFDGKDAKEGDSATIDFSAIDEDGNKQFDDIKDFKFDILSGVILKDFEKNFLGKNKFDKVEFEVTFPQDYKFVGKVAGKTLKINAYIKDIKRYDSPISIEDLGKHYGCSSIEELRYRIRDFTRQEFEREIFAINRIKLFEALKDKLTFDIPPTLLKSEKERIKKIKREILKLKAQGDPNTAIDSNILKLEDEVEITKEALEKSRASMVFAECVSKHGITITQQEFENYVNQEVSKHKEADKEKIIKACHENRDTWVAFTLEQKSIKYIMETKVNLVEKFVTLEEMKNIISEARVDIINAII
jgi:trigger factor